MSEAAMNDTIPTSETEICRAWYDTTSAFFHEYAWVGPDHKSSEWLYLISAVAKALSAKGTQAERLERFDTFIKELRTAAFETAAVGPWPEHWGPRPKYEAA